MSIDGTEDTTKYKCLFMFRSPIERRRHPALSFWIVHVRLCVSSPF